jgi:hypothetical protein
MKRPYQYGEGHRQVDKWLVLWRHGWRIDGIHDGRYG